MNDQVIRGFLASFQVFPPLLVEFQFNPDRIEDNKQVNFQPQHGHTTAPKPRYVGGGERTIAFGFKLHGLERGVDPVNPTGIENGIAPMLAALRSFVHPRSDAMADLQGALDGSAAIAPPTCVFGFGDRLLECRVTQLSVSETQFNQHLVPVRADCNITLTVIEDPDNPFYQLDRARRNLLAGRQATLDIQQRVERLGRGRIL